MLSSAIAIRCARLRGDLELGRIFRLDPIIWPTIDDQRPAINAANEEIGRMPNTAPTR